MRTVPTFLGLSVLIFGIAVDGAAQNVTWTNAVNVTVSGTTLQKTSGCDGCDDAGAVSAEEIPSGDGYVEFTIGETNTFFLAGLSHGDEGTAFFDIDFAFRFNGAGSADVLENGVYLPGSDTPYAVGDVFRVAVVGNKVQFIRNELVLLEQTRTLQYPLLLDIALATMGATIREAHVVVGPPPDGPGGFIEKAGSQSFRARFTQTEIQAFLPANGGRGLFTFPAPYHTQGLRLTSDDDCANAQDCVWYVGYSYWRNINNHVGSASMLVFLGLNRDKGGEGPTLFAVDKLNDQVQKVGPLFDPSSTYSYATGEGWYFSATQPAALYTFLVGGGRLRRYDVLTHVFDPKDALNIDACPKPRVCPEDAATIFQPHSSDDDLVHSVTVQDMLFRRIGCLVYRSHKHKFHYFAVTPGYTFDECHVDKSGRWLVILEGTQAGMSNRIIDLEKGAVRVIDDGQGSLGHLDMGHGYAVGADNYNSKPNATIVLKFDDVSTPAGPVVHYNKRWDIAAANHVAHGNARSDIPPESQFACGSNASRVIDMADEIVCFPLNANRNANGLLDVLVVGQTMTNLDAFGGGGDYEKTPKGNLDVTGKYFIWTTNFGGDRLHAVLVKIPPQLGGGIPLLSQIRGRKSLRTSSPDTGDTAPGRSAKK
jgi:hypothetical protein